MIPLYAQGDDMELMTQTVTFVNILDDPNYVIGMVFCLIIFTVIVYYILFKFYSESMKIKQASRCKLEERSLEISYFDAEMSLEDGESKLKEKCDELQSGAAESVKLAPYCKDLYLLLVKMAELQKNIQHYKDVNEKNEEGERAKMLDGLEMVDAQEKLEKDEEELKAEIDKNELAKDKNSSFAIVI